MINMQKRKINYESNRLKENECIHCETEEQANAICKLMHEAGLKWKFGNSYIENTYYESYKSDT